MSDDDNLTSCAHEKNVCGKVFCVVLPSLTKKALLLARELLQKCFPIALSAPSSLLMSTKYLEKMIAKRTTIPNLLWGQLFTYRISEAVVLVFVDLVS